MYEWNSGTASFSSPYRFNGKELDQETGLAYYGARYYDNKISMWLSVDPLAMERHNITMTPYHFSSNNPIMRVDPDGLSDYFTEDGTYLGSDNSDMDDVRVMSQEVWNGELLNNRRNEARGHFFSLWGNHYGIYLIGCFYFWKPALYLTYSIMVIG